jgi:hypothetical protein
LYSLAKARIQLSTAWAETRRRNAIRCIDMPLRYNSTVLSFSENGLPRGVVRINWSPHC